MNELFRNFQLVLLILMAILFAIGFVVMVLKYIKTKGLEGIREDVYKLFLKAEHKWEENGQGDKKMEWVVQKARSLLPSWMQAFISEKLLKNIIQFWFDGIKDLLDDGKLNKSANKTEE